MIIIIIIIIIVIIIIINNNNNMKMFKIEILSDFPIETDHEIEHNRSDLVTLDKHKAAYHIIDIE